MTFLPNPRMNVYCMSRGAVDMSGANPALSSCLVSFGLKTQTKITKDIAALSKVKNCRKSKLNVLLWTRKDFCGLEALFARTQNSAT